MEGVYIRNSLLSNNASLDKLVNRRLHNEVFFLDFDAFTTLHTIKNLDSGNREIYLFTLDGTFC